MRVIRAIEPLLNLAEPLTSPFLALAMVLLLPLVVRRVRGVGLRVAILSGSVLLFGAAYHLAAQNAAAARWLAALNTPLVAVFLVIILPAMYLPRGRAYRFFLLLPAACVLLAVLGVMDAYRSVPPGKEGFYWFLVRPAYFMGGIASALVLLEPVLSLKWFRFAVRTACALALIYGGFAFRRDYSDYQAMLARRPQAKAARNLLNLSETSPVLRSDERMTYLPSAPCRFTADGGYVQGCNLELFQRMMMVNYGKLFTKDPDPAMTSQMRLLLGALVLLLATCFMAGRWFCGWVCPLSAIGGVLDFLRRTFRLPHFKPTVRMKKIYVYVGLCGVGSSVVGRVRLRWGGRQVRGGEDTAISILQDMSERAGLPGGCGRAGRLYPVCNVRVGFRLFPLRVDRAVDRVSGKLRDGAAILVPDVSDGNDIGGIQSGGYVPAGEGAAEVQRLRDLHGRVPDGYRFGARRDGGDGREQLRLRVMFEVRGEVPPRRLPFTGVRRQEGDRVPF